MAYPTPPKRSRSAPPRRKRFAKKSTATSIPMGGLMVKRIPRGIPLGCPKEMRVKLKYNTTGVFTAPAAGVTAFLSYRANGPFDPQASVGGDQPRYYDQWSAIYNSVTTVQSKCTVEFANEQYDTTARNAYVGVLHSALNPPLQGSGSLTRIDAIEAPYSVHRLASGNNAIKCTLTWNPNQYFIGKTIYDEDIASQVTTTPVRDCYFHIWTAQDIVSGLPYPGRTYMITIEYDVIFFDPVIPTQS